MFLFVPSAPTSPREIKSYHLIDLSALDSPQTHRKADSPPSFEASSPTHSSLLESTFHSVADQDFNELGRPAYVLLFSLSSEVVINTRHNVTMLRPVITEFDDHVSRKTQKNSGSYYEDLLQVRFGFKDKGLKVIFI